MLANGGSVHRSHSGFRHALRHLVPETLSVRLAVTIALASFATTAVAVGVCAWIASDRMETWMRTDVAATQRGFERFTTMEQEAFTAETADMASNDRMANAVLERDLDPEGPGPAHVLEMHMELCSALIMDNEGRPLYTMGNAVEVTELEHIASAADGGEVAGLLRMSGGPALTSGHEIRDGENGPTVGYMILCRPLSKAGADWFEALDGDVRLTVLPAGSRPSDVEVRPDTGKVDGLHIGQTATSTVAIWDLPSIGGGSAGVLRIDDSDASSTRALSVVVVSAGLSGLAALMMSGVLAVSLTRMTKRPVARMVEQVKTQGYLAAEGLAYPTDEVADDPTLPLEFRELGAVVEDLLRHLNARQSELKEAIREAEYAEETLGIVVSESLEVKIVLRDGRVVIANPAASIALGIPSSDMVNMTIAELFADAEICGEDGVTLEPFRLLSHALEDCVTISLKRPEQPERWYAVQAVRHADDVRNRVLLSARDVTEERRLASIRAEIVSLITHDIRSPLTVVIGYLDLLQRPMGGPEQGRAIEAARRNAGRVADLLEDLLSATRAEELLTPSELQPVSLSSLAEEVVASLGPTHPDQELRLELETTPTVMGEEKRLRQVLVNLITNAYKYALGSDPITVMVCDDGKQACLRVIDRGPGVPEDERAHVFDRFARLENGVGQPGVGLGLYIVNTITRNHGGDTRVEETPGGGATFVVELPLAEDAGFH